LIKNLFYLFLLFFLGVLLKKRFEKNLDALIDFIIYISLPSLIITNIYRLKIEISFINYILFGWFITIFLIFISFIIGKSLKLNKDSLLSFVMVSTFANTAFIGYPYVETFLGKEALGYAIIFDNFASFLPVVTLGGIILSMKNGRYKIDIKKILTFPPFLVLILAFFLKNFYLPQFLLETLEKIGSTVTPLALFAVGAKIDFSKIDKIKAPVILSIVIKMIIAPILAFILIKSIFFIDIKAKAVIFEIAMPPMVLASILVIKEKLDANLAVASVGIGVLISFITIPVIYKIIN